jgi:multiple sugar transport system permease protein
MTRERPGPFLAPAAIVLGAVAAFPALSVLWLSLEQRSPLAGAARFVGLDNYARLLADARFWNALWNTAYFSVASVALELLFGLGMALLLARAFRGRALVYSIVLLPWAVPTVVSARLWEWMYNADYGVINHLLGTHVNWLGSPTWALNAAIVMDVWKATPFVALLLLAGLQAIPRELYQAAALDGAGAWTAFRRITLPLLAPLMLVVLIFRTIDAFRVFDAIYVLTGGGPANSTETLSIYAYKVLFQTLEFGYGSALAVSVLAVVALLTAVYARLLKRSAP